MTTESLTTPIMPIKECDILIQAGRENTPDDKTGGSGPLGNEIDWTPIVTDEAVVPLGTLIESRNEDEHLRLSRYFIPDERRFDGHAVRVVGCKIFSNEFNPAAHVLHRPVKQNVVRIVDVYDLQRGFNSIG